MSNVLDEPTRFPCSTLRVSLPVPCYAPPPPLAHMLRNVAGKSNVIAKVGSLCASGSGSSPAQPWSIMLTVIPRAMKTPDRHTCCGERRATSAPVPHTVSLSRPRFTVPRRPSRPPPQEVRRNRCHENWRCNLPANEPGTRSCFKTPLTRNATRIQGCSGTVNR